MADVLLECKQLTMKYQGQEIFSDLNLAIQQGEILTLVGPSGSGKTTLLRCLAGLEQPLAGSIHLRGQEITQQRAEVRPIIMMFQQPLLFPHLTVLDNVVYGLQMKGIPNQQRIQLGMELLEKFELSQFAHQYPFQLSGGQQQRVSLGRALIMQPQLLLLDEPFSSLDPELRVALRLWLRDQLKSQGVTALFVTHNREEAMVLGDRVAMLMEGQLQQIGSPSHVYRHPANKLVAEFFSDGLVLEGDGFVPADKLNLHLMDQALSGDHIRALKGIIIGSWLKGGRWAYHLQLGNVDKAITLWADSELQVGDQVMVTFRSIDVVPLNE